MNKSKIVPLEPMIIFVNKDNKKDRVHWYSKSGRLVWAMKHRDGLKSYLGSDGSKMQIMWEDDDPTPYWGW